MLNLSRIQLELEKAKEGLREVEETIQKVEGKTFLNGPGRYVNIKVQVHSDKSRNLLVHEDSKTQRKNTSSNVELRSHRFTSDDPIFNLKRNTREKRDGGFKRHSFDTRPQSISVRLMGSVGSAPSAADDDDDEEFTKKLSLPSRVISTASEAPSRQDIIAAQTGDEMVKQRNRRMFGALVGTLQKFCKEETRVREREEKRMKVERKLEEDAKREREKLLQEKRELFLERKRREVEIKRIEWSLNRVKEYEAWETNVLPLKNFIQTRARPHIFYLPNTHNSKTQELLAESQKTVEKMIEKRKNNLKEEIENSERKAKRTVAEEEEGEEAENIPHDDSRRKDEDPADMNFDAANKENGYHPEDSKAKNMETLEEEEDRDDNEEGAWSDKNADPEADKDNPGLVSTVGDPQMEDPDFDITTYDEGTHDGGNNKEGDNDGKNNNKVDNNGGNNNEGDNDGGGGDIEDSQVTGKGKALDEGKRNNKQREFYDSNANESDSDTLKLPTNESENARKLTENETECKSPIQEFQEKPEDGKKEGYGSESDKKHDDDYYDDTAKKADGTKRDHERCSEVSPKTSKRRYRSRGRRSNSPRRFAKTRRRSRSSSRRRNSNRRSHSYSKSPSQSKKCRRSPRYHQRSGRGSPPPKRRNSRSRRRSSSKSCSSASPRKRMKFRSPASSNSRSDSD